jgi:hypothetical protein
VNVRPHVFCGLDWAEGHHDIALVDPDGKFVAKRRVTDNAQGFAELLELLAEAGDSAENPIPVAIETSRGLMVAALRATGRPVYAINPMAVARYRERHSVSGKKVRPRRRDDPGQHPAHRRPHAPDTARRQ